MKIINKQPAAFLQNLAKSMNPSEFSGAFYIDNAKNRKLGRVGRPYAHKEEIYQGKYYIQTL